MAPASKADHDSVNIRSCRRLREGVGLVFQGISRTLGSAPDQKNAAITAEVRAMVETLSPISLIGVRDRTLLLVGFAAAVGAGHRGGDRGCVGASEHGPDRTQIAAYDPTAHPRWLSVQEQCRGRWPVNRTSSRAECT
jgi:hypothetical protein